MRDSTSVTTSCTVQRRNGHFCDAPAWPDAPFPICRRHAVKLFMHMRDLIGDPYEPEMSPHLTRGAVTFKAQNDAIRARPSYVYYVQVGGLIKIGMTTNLRQRMCHYPPDSKLLATELGSADVESQRHYQFRHLLAHGNEWFRMAPDLDAHITKLRDVQRRTHTVPVAG